MTSPCGSSVPANRAKLFDLWAAKVSRLPATDRLADFIELRQEGDLGTHAVAKKSFNNGDLILREDALLRIPEAPRDMQRRTEQRYGRRSAFLFPCLGLDWSQVSEDVKTAVLNLFWCHPLMESSSTVRRDSHEECADLLKWNEHLGRSWTVDDLLRYLHIVDLNIHKDDEEQSNAAFSGLFVFGSKFSHSCAPNCTWSFSQDGCLQYHAVRTIEPGDPLTFSYIGNGMNMVTGTVSRRRRLGSLWFVCLCERCQKPDISRQMRCPKCNTPKCVPDDKPADGQEWSCDRHIDIVVPEAKVWKCQACASTFKSDEMKIRQEERFSQEVPQVMQGKIQTVEQDIEKVSDLRKQITVELGQGHWTWMLSTFAWMQKCLIVLDNLTVVGFSESDLQAASRSVAGWFEEFAPELMEQRLAALSLTLRLMNNLGTRKSEPWGYKPGNPLGDGTSLSSFAKRFGFSKEFEDASTGKE